MSMNEDIFNPLSTQTTPDSIISPEDRYETLISEIILDKRVGSLARECCFVADCINTLKPAILGMTVESNGSISFKKTTIETVISKDVKVPISIEAMEDMEAYSRGKLADELSKAFRYMCDHQENVEFFNYLDRKCTKKEDFIINDDMIVDIKRLTSALLARIQKEIIHMNLASFKGLESFCIISPKHIQKIGYELDSVESWVALGKKNNITFYVNPLQSDDKVYIGLRGSSIQSSSIVFSPVSYKISKGVNPYSLGSPQFSLIHRFGFIDNPLSVKEPVLVTFNIVDNPNISNPGDK